MIVIEFIVVLLFLVWGIATLFYQFSVTEAFVSNYNYFSLIPKWTFFAPIPKTSDFILYYQDYDTESDLVLKPIEIDLHGEESRFKLIRTIWNPEKRPLKAITDITTILVRYKKKHQRKINENPLVLELYTPYIILVNFVNNYTPPSTKSCKRRFLIYSSYGYFTSQGPIKTFESHFHEFD